MVSIGYFLSSEEFGPKEHGGFKVCHAPTVEDGVRTAHRLWPNENLPGELSQVLPTPRHFEQASGLVTEQTMADAVHVQQIGPEQDAFFEFWATEVAPRLQPTAVPR